MSRILSSASKDYLNAELSIEYLDGKSSILLETRHRDRNPDYAIALETILARLAKGRKYLRDALVENAVTAKNKLPPENCRLKIGKYPINLSKIENFENFRKEMTSSKVMAKAGVPPGKVATGHNPLKRIRLYITDQQGNPLANGEIEKIIQSQNFRNTKQQEEEPAKLMKPHEKPDNAHKNDFLLDLLKYRVDAEHGYSSPGDWSTKPKFFVETEVTIAAKKLAQDLCGGVSSGKFQGSAKWLILIGSPGNGKSIATGVFYREILANNIRGISFDPDIKEGALPHTIKVYYKNNGKNHPIGYIINDASVVRDIAESKNPWIDLLETLEDASKRGIFVIANINRGILENAAAHAEKHSHVLRDELKRIRQSNSQAPSPMAFNVGGKPVWESVEIQHRHLDTTSLLDALPSEETQSPLDQICEKVTASTEWQACNSCNSKPCCPFQLNRQELSSQPALFTGLLNQAELYSGKPIVFREVMGLLSFILAGNAKDYDSQHPCEWVHARVNSQDFFTLLGRRTYISIYSAYDPYYTTFVNPRKETASLAARDRGREALIELSGYLDDIAAGKGHAKVLKAFTASLRRKSLAAPPGLDHLLGLGGVFHQMDALMGVTYEPWHRIITEDNSGSLPSTNAGTDDELEEKAIETWKNIELDIESLEDRTKVFRYFDRWRSGYMLRRIFFRIGLINLSRELKILDNLVAGTRTTSGALPLGAARELIDNDASLIEQINLLLAGGGIRLNKQTKCEKPSLIFRIAKYTRNALEVHGAGKHVARLPLRTVCWILWKVAEKMTNTSLPAHLLQELIKLQERAIGASNYHRKGIEYNEDLSLLIETEDGSTIKLERKRGTLLP